MASNRLDEQDPVSAFFASGEDVDDGLPTMSWIEHLEILRKRIFISLIAIAVGFKLLRFGSLFYCCQISDRNKLTSTLRTYVRLVGRIQSRWYRSSVLRGKVNATVYLPAANTTARKRNRARRKDCRS